MSSAGHVLMIFRSAVHYRDWIRAIEETGGFTFFTSISKFHHKIEINDVMLETILDYNSWTGLNKFMLGRSRFDWIICRDFWPCEMETTLFKTRLLENGALSAGDLFVYGPEEIKFKYRWLQ